ncbi:MAG: MBL fold metallo-hydrolase [Verrucomicrobiae bacterium]|nr:MBL fold metallo-hydrolase [Verrucomicrobiae bacterium]
MKIHMMTGGIASTNAYFISNAGQSVLIDAPEGAADWVSSLLEDPSLRLHSLILTHGHFDHTWDAAVLRKKNQCEVLYHPADAILIETPEIQAEYGFPKVTPVKATRLLTEGNTLDFGPIHLRILHIPGHCPGNVALVWDAEKTVFVGDVIFAGSIGRTDLPGGSLSLLLEGIRDKLWRLPDDYRILSGHGPATTIGQEKKSNPYLKA